MRLSPPGTHFTAESTEAMQIRYIVQGNNILLPGFEPSTVYEQHAILIHKEGSVRFAKLSKPLQWLNIFIFIFI